MSTATTLTEGDILVRLDAREDIERIAAAKGYSVEEWVLWVVLAHSADVARMDLGMEDAATEMYLEMNRLWPVRLSA